MGALRNPRYEIFAQEIATGCPVSKAYELAGFKGRPHNLESNGRRLRNNPKIRERVKELSLAAAELAGVHLGAIQLELARIGYANAYDVMRRNDKDEVVPVFDPTRPVSRELAAAVAELGFDSKGRPKIKFHDKRAALSDLGKMVGGIPDPLADSITGLGDRLDRAISRANQG